MMRSLIPPTLLIASITVFVDASDSQAHDPFKNLDSPRRTSMDYPPPAQSPNGFTRFHYWKAAEEKPPVGCYTKFDHFSCGSLTSEVHFIFGSCRKFFGELCLKAPPPSPIDVYRYNQRLYPNSGDHTVENHGYVPVFGNTPETMPPPLELKEKRFGDRLFGNDRDSEGKDSGCRPFRIRTLSSGDCSECSQRTLYDRYYENKR